MSRPSVVAAVLLSVAWFESAPQALAQHTHEHAPAPASLAVPAQRWIPDAPLRAGIRDAHQAIDALQPVDHAPPSAATVRDRAAVVEKAVLFMFANCKLSAEPDAALHGILVPLLTAAQALQADPGNTGALADMQAAIVQYPTYFDDPGWDQPAQPAPAEADAHGK